MSDSDALSDLVASLNRNPVALRQLGCIPEDKPMNQIRVTMPDGFTHYFNEGFGPAYEAVLTLSQALADAERRIDELQARNYRLTEAVDKTATALSVETAARKEWKDLCLYGFHLAQYGENAPGGTETWGEFERRLRQLSAPPVPPPNPLLAASVDELEDGR